MEAYRTLFKMQQPMTKEDPWNNSKGLEDKRDMHIEIFFRLSRGHLLVCDNKDPDSFDD